MKLSPGQIVYYCNLQHRILQIFPEKRGVSSVEVEIEDLELRPGERLRCELRDLCARKFNTGDEVFHINARNWEGEIVAYSATEKKYTVKWSNGAQNDYPEEYLRALCFKDAAGTPTFEIMQMVRYGGCPFIIVERRPDSSSSDGWKYKLNFYEDKWVTVQELEPNNNQPAPKFKVGDRVRKNTWKERSWAEVTWVAYDGSHFKFKFQGKGIQNPEAQDPADFHLVEPNPATTMHDKVKAIFHKTCFLDEYAGLPRLPVPEALLNRPIPHILKHLNQETTMNPIKIKNRTEVNGIDVDNLTDGQIVALISESEKQIKTLKELDHKPKRIEKLIAELESGITQLVDVLDKREEK